MKRNDSLVKLISGSILFVILVALGLMTGCDENQRPTELAKKSTNNPTIPVEFLFEHEGCRVFAFTHDSYRRYFTRCERHDSTTSSVAPHRCGKTACPKFEEIAVEAAK